LLAVLILFVYLAIISVYWNGRVKYYEKTNSGKLPPADTPEGKRERLIISGMLVMTVVVVALTAFGSNLGTKQAITSILIFSTIAIFGFAIRMGTRK